MLVSGSRLQRAQLFWNLWFCLPSQATSMNHGFACIGQQNQSYPRCARSSLGAEMVTHSIKNSLRCGGDSPQALIGALFSCTVSPIGQALVKGGQITSTVLLTLILFSFSETSFCNIYNGSQFKHHLQTIFKTKAIGLNSINMSITMRPLWEPLDTSIGSCFHVGTISRTVFLKEDSE